MWIGRRTLGFRRRTPSRLTHWLFVCGHFHDLINRRSHVRRHHSRRQNPFIRRAGREHRQRVAGAERAEEGNFCGGQGRGFDVEILKEIIKRRKQDKDERDEREGLLDLYMRAMETAPVEKTAKAA